MQVPVLYRYNPGCFDVQAGFFFYFFYRVRLYGLVTSTQPPGNDQVPFFSLTSSILLSLKMAALVSSLGVWKPSSLQNKSFTFSKGKPVCPVDYFGRYFPDAFKPFDIESIF